jgi:hypothetical protein
LGTGPFDDGAEQRAARLLGQLSEYTTMLVRQEVLRAELQRERERTLPTPRDLKVKSAERLACIGVTALVAAGVIEFANVIGAGLAALIAGTALLILAAPIVLKGLGPSDDGG